MRCEHQFVFLRQEERVVNVWGRDATIVKIDAYHCEKCLEYKTKKVAELSRYSDGRSEWIPEPGC